MNDSDIIRRLDYERHRAQVSDLLIQWLLLAMRAAHPAERLRSFAESVEVAALNSDTTQDAALTEFRTLVAHLIGEQRACLGSIRLR